MANLPSGYHRDMQLIKENFIPAFQDINDCLRIANFMLKQVKIKENTVKDPKYLYMYSVEVVNNMVLQGVPFRDAYKQVGGMIENKTFTALDTIHHTHEGSIGNLMNKEIQLSLNKTLNEFGFHKTDEAIAHLLKRS